LGFRPPNMTAWRKALWQGDIHTYGFLPAARPKALTSISRAIRRWALHHHSDKSLQDLESINRRHGMASRQRDDLIQMGKKKTIGSHVERVSPLLNQLGKGRLDLAWPTCIYEEEASPAR
jgi:hypothetical protein